MQSTTLFPGAVLVLATILAGCVGGPDGPAEAPTSSSAAAPPGNFDDATGAIRGIVMDRELRPVPGAQVALQKTEFASRTALDGSFSFSHVPPGDYVLVVGALGYTSATKQVSVQAGTETAGVNVQVDAIPVVEPRTEMSIFDGYITCTIGLQGARSEECGQGLQTELGTFGTNPNNKIDWRWNFTADQVDLVGTLIEMDWIPGSAAASELTLYVANKFTCTPSCDADGPEYCGTDNFGPPPQRCYIDKLKMKEDEMPWSMTARAWGGPGEDTPNVVLEQKFTMYRTDFYGALGPEDHSAIPDA